MKKCDPRITLESDHPEKGLDGWESASDSEAFGALSSVHENPGDEETYIYIYIYLII
jgi:hypothetical protein